MNTFSQYHIDGINRLMGRLGSKVVAKRSRVFKHAAVIGIPGEKGAVILSLIQENEDPNGRGVWLLHHFSDMEPKALADGKNVVWSMADEYRCYYWAELIGELSNLCCTDIPGEVTQLE